MTTTEKKPLVWVLRSEALGGDGQSIALAETLGWPYENRHITFKNRQKGFAKYRGRFFSPTLSSIDASKSDELCRPWPDLVIAAGRRQVPVEFWIRTQNRGKTRLVHIGLPIAPVNMFDLVICDAYPAGKNVFSPSFPLMRKDKPKDVEYLTLWENRLQNLPRPWVSLLVGGPANPFIMPTDLGQRLIHEVSEAVEVLGGTLLISTSRRTPTDIARALYKFRPSNSFFFEWQPSSAVNPYFAMVHLSDQIIVTSDSVSMIIEAIRAGKPTEIYRLPEGKKRVSSRSMLIKFLYRSAYNGYDSRLSRFADKLRTLGFIDMPDHLKVFARRLVTHGSASYLGENAARMPTPLPDEMLEIVKTIKQWY